MRDTYETLCNVVEDTNWADTIGTLANIAEDEDPRVAAILQEALAKIEALG